MRVRGGGLGGDGVAGGRGTAGRGSPAGTGRGYNVEWKFGVFRRN